MDTKKDVGEMFLSVLIPIFRPSHCPYRRISNFKPAHVVSLSISRYGTANPMLIYTNTVNPSMEFTT